MYYFTFHINSKSFLSTVFFVLIMSMAFAQITVNINSGNPNHPFPQFYDYKGGTSLASQNGVGIPHAEMEQRARDAYQMLTNTLTYNVTSGGVTGPLTVAGVKYISPKGAVNQHCTCVEGDGYNLLAAAYMADKATFDGYYMWVHDRQLQKTRRFVDCIMNSPGYNYAPGISGAGSFGSGIDVKGGALGGNSATDGDDDLSMALLVAWKQWGDNGVICIDPCTGNPITYKDEAIRYIKTMVDTVLFPLNGVKYTSGVIGLDGYHKSGDSWGEATNWASGGYLGMIPETGVDGSPYVDYAAPAYWETYAEMLTAEGESPWCIEQYKRAEASDDWLVGQNHAKGNITWAGKYTVNATGTATTFSNFMESEDNRFAWRTHLNYLWNGAPTRTWNPVTHQYTAGTNTYEYDAAMRMATFMKNPEAAPYNNTCFTSLTGMQYGGTSNIKWGYNPDGTGGGAFPLNWAHGTSAPAACVSGDRNLMAQMFRQCVIEWDAQNGPAQQYLTSMPRYFHDWNRLLGMIILSGNLPDPMDMGEKANMKVYMDVDKTYASSCDEVTYEISYRNYGKKDATNVSINDLLPAGLTYVSSTIPATVAGNSVTFNIGTVPGFKTGGLAATKGVFSLTVKVEKTATGRLCNTATITCSNGSGWTSNEYPNNDTPVMERNCVDILSESPLTIRKTASKAELHPGDTVSYTIVVKNSSVAFLNGGRPGVIIAGSHDGLSAAASSLRLRYRVYHGAEEAYINYQNYRVSYYLNKPGPPAWVVDGQIKEGVPAYPSFTQQNIPIGATWNHRFILTFPDQLATITPFLDYYSGMTNAIHQGALEAMRVAVDVHDASYANYNWTTDWSSEPTMNAADGAVYWPIAKDWTDPLLPNQSVLKYHPNNCSNNVTKTITKQLVEEWDGYTWRRIYGDAPISGRELNNVVVTDILPAGVTFGGYFAGYPTGTLSGGTITWPTIANMKINDSTIYKFWVTVDGACPKADQIYTNIAKANATNECEVADTAIVTATCNPIIVVPPLTSMKKTANAASYNVGDPITYTIGYKNTHGTIVSGAISAADWNVLTGTTGKLSVNGAGVIDMNSAWASKGMTYKYSHGTDGIIKGTATFKQYGGPYSIVVRSNGVTWTEIRFKVENANVQVSYFNMPANTQIGATQTITYGALPGAFDFQIQLAGAVANVWLVNSGSVIAGAAPITANIPIQAGYAGVRSTDGSTPSTLANWYTALDSGFDQQMTDALPPEVTFVSAANGGTNVAGTVTWPKIAGPVLANDTITYTWTGTVSSCSGGTITNTAYVQMMGITPSPGAQNIVTCATSVTPTVPGVIGSNQTICYNTTPAAFTSVTAASGGDGTYAYQWQSSTDSTVWSDIAGATSTTYTSLPLSDTTWFRRKVTSGGAPVYTAPVKVIVYTPLTGGTVGTSQTICYNSVPAAFTNIAAPGGGTGIYTYQWQSSADSTVWANIVGATAQTYTPVTALTTKTYYKRVATSGTCGSAGAPVTVNVYADLTAGSIGTAQSICASKAPNALTELTAATGGTGTYTYQWQSSADNITYANIAAATSSTYAPGGMAATMYFKRVVTSGACGSVTTSSVKITILQSDSAKIIPAGPFCNSDPITTIQLTGGSTSGGTWSGTGITNTSSGTFDPSALALGSYKIKYQTVGSCPEADSINILISNGIAFNITSPKTSYCKNGAVDTIEVDVPGGLYRTSSGKGITDVNFGYYDPKLANIGIDTIWYYKAGQCGDTAFIEINVLAADTAKITLNQTYCESEGIVILSKEVISAAGTWSGTGITNTTTGAFDPSVGAGSYLITYTTAGTCPVQDTATVIVYDQKIADIVTQDTTMCQSPFEMAFSKKIELSTNTSASGTWTCTPNPALISNTGYFDLSNASAGNYDIEYEVLGGTAGCDAKDKITITVSPVDVAKITLNQGPYCLADLPQTLQTDPGAAAGTWSGKGITDATSGIFDPGTAGEGKHWIHYTTNGICWVDDSLQITVVDKMYVKMILDQVSICEDTTLFQIQIDTMMTTPGGTWSSLPAGFVNASGQFDPSIATAGTTYTVDYTVNGVTPACTATDFIDITVVQREEAAITTLPDTLCSYGAAVALSPNTGTWSGIGVTGTNFDPSAALAGGNSPFEIRHKVSGATGTCPDEDTLFIPVLELPDTTIASASKLCLNSSPENLVAVTKGGLFSGNGVSGAKDAQSFNAAIAGAGIHTVTYTLGAGSKCPVSSSLQIKVDSVPIAVIVPDINIDCVPLTINFGDSSSADVFKSHWDFGDGSVSDLTTADASVSHTYTTAGNNIPVKLTIEFINGCKDDTIISISAVAVPIPDFTYNPEVISALDPKVNFFDASTGGTTSVMWHFGKSSNPDSSALNDVTALFNEPKNDTIIPVTLIASNAYCDASVTKNVTIKGIFSIYIPNAFSPNGDGKNDEFFPDGLGHICDACDNYDFSIFNRWGELIYSTNVPYQKWNGKRGNNLRDAEIDVYVWKLTYTNSFNGKPGQQIGKVTLIR